MRLPRMLATICALALIASAVIFSAAQTKRPQRAIKTMLAPISTFAIQDSFSDLDGIALVDHIGESGATWRKLSYAANASLFIESGTVIHDATGLRTIHYVSNVTLSHNLFVSFVVKVPDHPAGVSGIVFNIEPNFERENFYAVTYSFDTHAWRVTSQEQAGTGDYYEETLATWPQDLQPGQLESVRVERRDNAILVLFNGVAQIAVQDTAHEGGFVGIAMSDGNNSAAIDNFTADTIPDPTPTPTPTPDASPTPTPECTNWQLIVNTATEKRFVCQ